MATNTAGTVARNFQKQMIHYLRKTLTYAAGAGTAVDVGTVPAGSLLLGPVSGVAVTTVFVSTSSTVATNIDIGTTANDDVYATNLASTALGFVPFDEAVSQLVSADTKIIATIGSTGTVTAGEAEVIIAYIPDNDQ
jgi:hypothetical protein